MLRRLSKDMSDMSAQWGEFLRVHQGVYAPSTFSELIRRYRRISDELTAYGVTDFSTVKPDDIKRWVADKKARGITAKAILHDTASLGNLCTFWGCDAVAEARTKYPLLFYCSSRSRLPALTSGETASLISACNAALKGGWTLARGAGAVMLCYGAGLRTFEMQNSLVDNLDLSKRLITVVTVKGGGTYGAPRTVPLLPASVPLLRRYVALKDKQPPTVASSPYLFPNSATGGPVTTNSHRVGKSKIEASAGFSFDFRILRRSYAQQLIDSDAPLSAVSVVMGHLTTVTTERAYARMRGDTAIKQIQEVIN